MKIEMSEESFTLFFTFAYFRSLGNRRFIDVD